MKDYPHGQDYILVEGNLETVDSDINGLEEEIRNYLAIDDENQMDYYYQIILRKIE